MLPADESEHERDAFAALTRQLADDPLYCLTFPGLYHFSLSELMSLPTRTEEKTRDGKNDKP